MYWIKNGQHIYPAQTCRKGTVFWRTEKHCAQNKQQILSCWDHRQQGAVDSLCPVQPACWFPLPLLGLLFHHYSFNLHLPFCLLSVLLSFSFSFVTKEIYTYRWKAFITLFNSFVIIPYFLLCTPNVSPAIESKPSVFHVSYLQLPFPLIQNLNCAESALILESEL